jgi:hypothetical protein
VVDTVKKLEHAHQVTPRHKKIIEQILWKLGAFQITATLSTSTSLHRVGKVATSVTAIASSASKTTLLKPQEEQGVVAPTVMISYNWDNQHIVVELANQLKKAGCLVWLDLEEMVGSSLEAMASAVESSQVVLICMSRKYKESANCRLEAEYAFRRKKALIPLMMQPQYDADGWLGAVVGTKIWYTVTRIEDVPDAVKGLMKELKKLGLHPTSKVPQEITTIPTPPVPVVATVPSNMKPEPILWTVNQVGEWLERIGLSEYKKSFIEQRMCGKALAYLAKTAPKKFTHHPTSLQIIDLTFNCSGDYLKFLYELEYLFF